MTAALLDILLACQLLYQRVLLPACCCQGTNWTRGAWAAGWWMQPRHLDTLRQTQVFQRLLHTCLAAQEVEQGVLEAAAGNAKQRSELRELLCWSCAAA
jgi:hypothetical protein